MVSLASATRRREHIELQLRRANVNYTMCDTVVGNLLSEDEVTELCDSEALAKHPTWLTRGAIGCALSHLYIYRDMVKNNTPFALVLEDDMILPKNLNEHLEALTPILHTEEVVMLYYQSHKTLLLSSHEAVNYKNEYHLCYPVDIHQPITTGAYLITLAAAKRLADGILPIRVSADSWGYFFDHGLLKSMRCTYPRLIDAEPFKSSIDYFHSSWKRTLSRWIDSVKLPGIYQMLRSRREKNLRKRQQVIYSEERPKWLK